MEKKDAAEKQRELQRIFMEVEAYRKQLEELSSQMQFIEGRRFEIASTIEAIDSLKDVKPGSQMMVPLGSDSFVKAELKDNKNVIVGVGAGISLEKKVSEAKAVLVEKDKRLLDAVNKLQGAVSEVNKKLSSLDSESKKLIQDLQ